MPGRRHPPTPSEPPESSPRRFLLLASCLSLTLLYTACNPPTQPTSTPTATPEREVSTSTAVQQPLQRTIASLGTFTPKQEAILSAKVPGRLAAIQVDLGSQVQAGDTLAEIETRDYELRLQQALAALDQARAALGLSPEQDPSQIDLEQTAAVREASAVLNQARADRERTQRLLQDGVLASADFDRAEASYQVALNRYESAREEVNQRRANVTQRQVEVEIARQQLADTTLLAPFNGAVQQRHANPGQFMRSGDPLLSLVQINPLRLRLEVPEKEALKIQTGQEIRFQLTGDTQQRTTQVHRISPALQQASRVLILEADVPNPGDLHPGSFAEARIVINTDTAATLIPTNALRTFAGIEKVFVLKENHAQERDVTTGTRTGPLVEITQGVQPGETVILNPGSLRNGSPVRPRTTP